MNQLKQAVKDRYIIFNKKANRVTYLPYGKSRSLSNPEELVQLKTFLALIYKYKYPVHRIQVCVPVKMGSSTKEADIVVYQDDECKSPLIIVECKKEQITQGTFIQAIDQGFSYAASTLAKFVWVTNGHQNAFYEVYPDRIGERRENKLPVLPTYQKERSFLFGIHKGIFLFLTAPLRLIKKLFSKSFKHPQWIEVFIISVMMLFFTLILSKGAVTYYDEIHDLTKVLWKKHGMHFGWIFYVITVCSSLFALLLSSSLELVPMQKKTRTKYIFFTLALMMIPIWYVESSYTLSWWNWKHYKKLPHKTWVYLQPQLVALPFQMGLLFFSLWIQKFKLKKDSIERTKRRKRS
ncbi:type I restriction enzyme HsdR N-terminal domain-containing protein [Sediminitomix flava]|uniref:Type I restriction and modification enzyme subunit R-like protein n=1 Tax=Sediminitomix flava TaxID=379075 RepID=A0A315ZJE5_SEDFL|nr:type I restriction enzyme HsdR N-terminal domain-containing protein [Sediminitomix flava]PWJ44814.1 type I restriction and modification enzyme subunit R-like protein [Sediminitomix flava]